jgi:putative glycosyltransferase
MKLSIVATLYQSAPYIEEFHRRASAVAQKLVGEDYEIVLVNDGSPDNSLDLAIMLAHSDPHLVVVDLSRNFGHHKAMMTGMAHAKGDHIFLIDSDLEEEPEWLIPFAAQMEQEKCDVVYGVQEKRRGGWFERWSGEVFYKLLRFLTKLDLPQNPITAHFMKRPYVLALLSHHEREIFLGGLWCITGFIRRSQFVQKKHQNKTTYTFRRKISLFVNAITSFSNVPLVSIFYLGSIIFTLASIYTAYLFVQRLFFSQPLTGWTSIMASIWLLGGLMICFIGIVGVYLAKVFSEVKRRPLSIVRTIYQRGSLSNTLDSFVPTGEIVEKG